MTGVAAETASVAVVEVATEAAETAAVAAVVATNLVTQAIGKLFQCLFRLNLAKWCEQIYLPKSTK